MISKSTQSADLICFTGNILYRKPYNRVWQNTEKQTQAQTTILGIKTKTLKHQ